jgi:uncharacterized protein involved in outer membrane biogenesis
MGMSATKRNVLFVSGGIITLFVLAIITLVLFVDLSAYKPRIEAAASDVMGMEVRINGKIGIVFSPGFNVLLKDISIKNRGVDIVHSEKVRIGLKLIPLIWHKVRITEFGLIKPEFSMERYKDSRFNFETPGKASVKERPIALISVKKFFISKGSVVYLDKKSGDKTEAKEIDLTIRDLSFSGKKGLELLRNISFTGNMKCGEIKTKSIEVSDLRADVSGNTGVFIVNPVTLNIFDGAGKGNINIDMTGESPVYSLHFAVSKLHAEKLFASFSRKKIMKGELDFSSDLSMKGKGWDEMKKTASGKVSLRGMNLVLYNMDIDYLLSSYEKTQNFKLVDIGAFFLAGPVGTLLTKGYDFASIYRETGREGTIRRLVSDWKVKNGIADAEDVALSTKQNRIALKGSLDFINDQYRNITLAVLDEKGCAKLSQKINGSFNKPQVEKVSILKSIAGSVINIFDKTKKFFTEGKCKVFYSGSVAHPK